MGEGPLYQVPFRRRREGKTDYRRRLALVKHGSPRVVVRRSNRTVTVQFVTYDETGDKVAAQAQSRELSTMGWSRYTENTPAAYLTGLLAGSRAKKAGIGDGVLDIGLQVPSKGGNLFAALKGVVDAGVTVPHGEGIFPTEERLRAEHLSPEAAAAFAATFEKIAGKPLPPKAPPAKKGKGPDKGGAPGKGAPPGKGGAPGKGGEAKPKGEGKPKGEAKPAGGEAKPPKDKKAKTPG